MSKDSFTLLRNREIIDTLIGDTILIEENGLEFKMPYLSGRKLCDISIIFGLNVTYSNSGQSRWMYIDDLLEYTNKNNRTSGLLKYLFDLENFTYLQSLLDTKEGIVKTRKNIILAALRKIDSILFFSEKRLEIINGEYYIVPLNKKMILDSLKVKKINVPYIQGLSERCKKDLAEGNYDSVLTKSRTLIEEVLIHILEKGQLEIESKGDILKLYLQVKKLNNMYQSKTYDKRVNSLLSGLERIVQSIAEMRNVGSDAHGAGRKRIEIKEREALLVLNSAMTFSQYILSINNGGVNEQIHP